MKNINNQYECLTDVEFHGGSAEQINDAELISDMEFRNIVWTCSYDYCGGVFKTAHDGVCPNCGCKLERQSSQYPAPRD